MDLAERTEKSVIGILDNVVGITKVQETVVEAIRKDEQVVHAIDQLRVICTAEAKDEKKMYPHLITIFNQISTLLSNSSDDVLWRFIYCGDNPPEHEDFVINLPKEKPDFLLLESPVPDDGKPTTRRKWKEIKSFIEVRADEHAESPYTGKDATLKTVQVQGADYSRLLYSNSPFRLFTLSILLYGSKCCVMFIDKMNCMLSPEFHVFDENGITVEFIRIICRFLCLTDQELGADPTVEVVPQDNSFHITMGSENHTSEPKVSWVTKGNAVWSSETPFGRGTSVWRAKQDREGRLVILKNAWRKKARRSETVIYGALRLLGLQDPGVIGIAHLVNGQDVCDQNGGVISVESIRKVFGLSPPNPITDNPILHRIVISTIGKPIWDFNRAQDFLIGSQDIVSGLKALEELGISHRDISPGNLMLEERVVENQGGHVTEIHGFIIDFQFAYIPRYESRDSNPGVEALLQEVNSILDSDHYKVEDATNASPSLPWPTTRTLVGYNDTPVQNPGPAMSGTQTYMALDVLRSVEKKEPIRRAPIHDLESFIWALFSSVYMHSIKTSQVPEKRRELQSEMAHYFPTNTIDKVIARKEDILRGNISSYLKSHSSHLRASVEPSLYFFILGILDLVKSRYPEEDAVQDAAEEAAQKGGDPVVLDEMAAYISSSQLTGRKAQVDSELGENGMTLDNVAAKIEKIRVYDIRLSKGAE
ncbi:hypothetical protein C8Q75DRAFT_805887 [Abortiporus biennis]|nr:hypothetical protein C8Q75DRAFT_805887 [Abortiporus biennis]